MEALFRHISSHDWITVICFMAFCLLIVAKKINSYHFKNFMLLFVTDKYVKIHHEDNSRKNIHTVLTLFQGLILPLLIHVILFNFKKIDNLNLSCYLKILAIYLVFFGSKFMLEKTVVIVFGLSAKLTSYLFEKQTYKNYFCIIFFPLLLLLVYQVEYVEITTFIVAIIGILLFLLAVGLIISHYRKLFYEAPFYFILYLCTFEIAPYILAYLWVNISC